MTEHATNNDDVINELQKKCEMFEGKFDRHLEIYRENGYESARVADALLVIQAHSLERDLKVDEMYKVHLDGIAVAIADKSRLQTVVLWGSSIAAIGIIGTTIKFLMK